MQKLVFGLFGAASMLLMMHCIDVAYARGTKIKNGEKGIIPLFMCAGIIGVAVFVGIIELSANRLQGKLVALVLALTGIAVFFERIYEMAKGNNRYRRISSIIVLSLLLVVSSFLLVLGLVSLCNV